MPTIIISTTKPVKEYIEIWDLKGIISSEMSNVYVILIVIQEFSMHKKFLELHCITTFTNRNLFSEFLKFNSEKSEIER